MPSKWSERKKAPQKWAIRKSPTRGLEAAEAQEQESSMMDPEVVLDTAHDMSLAAMQTATINQADKIAGTAAFLSEEDPTKMKDAYKNAKKAAAESFRKAREDSPVATTVADAITPTPFDALSFGLGKVGSVASKFAKGSRGLKSMLLSAPAEGAAFGAAYAPEGEEVLGTTVGFLSGLAGTAAVGAAKFPFKRGRETRQRAMGGDVPFFKEKGFKSPEKIDVSMEKMGLFKEPSLVKDFDPMSRKFVTAKSPRPPRDWRDSEVLYHNLSTGKNRLNELNNEILSSADKKFKKTSLQDVMTDIRESGGFDELIAESRVDPDISVEMDRFLKHVVNDEELGLSEIKEVKDYLQKIGREAFSSEGVPTPKAKLYADLSRKFNNWIEGALDYASIDAGKRFRMNSKAMSEMITQSDSLANRIAKQKGIPMGAPVQVGTGPTYMMSRATEKAGLSMPAAQMRAKIGIMGKKLVPGGAEDMMRSALPKGTTPYLDDERSPLDKYTSIPEMIMKTLIPRDSKSIVENKEFVLEKIRMQMPMMYDNVADIINKEPHKIPEILPMVISTAPHLFEADKYNRIDGKFSTPEGKARALEDTIKNEELSNTDKVATINRISTKGMM